MDTLWTAISWIARVFAWIGGAMIMLAALIVSAEVISRKLLSLPFPARTRSAPTSSRSAPAGRWPSCW